MNTLHRSVTIRVAGIIIRDEKILLVAHKKKGSVYWLLPGGGVKYGESLEDALKRELMEEVGAEVTVRTPMLISDSIEPHGKRHIVNICMLCDLHNDGLRLGREKRLHDLKFFNKDELKECILFPPINNALKSIIDGKWDFRYLGKLWLNPEN